MSPADCGNPPEEFSRQTPDHLGADHFAVLAATSDVTERIESSCHDLQSLITNPNIELKAGIRYLNKPLSNEALTLAFDNDAALACKSISKDATRHYASIQRKWDASISSRTMCGKTWTRPWPAITSRCTASPLSVL